MAEKLLPKDNSPEEISLVDVHHTHVIGHIPYEVADHCVKCYVCTCHDADEKLLRECPGKFVPDNNNN